MPIAYPTILPISFHDVLSRKPDEHGGKYYVETRFSDGRVHIYPAHYGFREWDTGSSYRTTDTWIDHLLGRSWERKMTDAQHRWQRWCDRKNEQDDREDYLNERYDHA